MLTIRKAILNSETETALISMSDRWASEDSCFGYQTNTAADLQDKDIFVADADGHTVGYLLCHPYVQEKESATVPPGKRCLEIDELYILPEYRSQGIGRALYEAAVTSRGDALDFVTLTTATKNYRAILHLYIEELGMTFWSSRLFQAIRHADE